MATLSKQGTEIARWQVDAEHGSARFSLRTNGKLLKQLRICGKWESWKIDANANVASATILEAVERRMRRFYGQDAKITRF